MTPRTFAGLCLAFALATRLHAQNAPVPAPGQRLFETHCAACHGPRGEGGKGPTLAQPSLPRASDDASLHRIIQEGINGTEMPRARLPEQDIALVAAFV